MIAMDKIEKWLVIILAVPTTLVFSIIRVFIRMLIYFVMAFNYVVHSNEWKSFISCWVVCNASKKQKKWS